MKKTISALIALVAFAFCMNACTNAQAKQNRSDDDIKEEVARRVKEIYDTVIPWYNSHEGDIRSINDFDGRFLSKEMQMMRAQVGAILRELHEKGEDDIPPGYDYDQGPTPSACFRRIRPKPICASRIVEVRRNSCS